MNLAIEKLGSRLTVGSPHGSSSRESLQWLMFARLGVLVTVMVIVVVQQIFRKADLPGDWQTRAYFFLSLGFAVNLLAALWLERLETHFAYGILQIIVDTTLISAWIWFSPARDGVAAFLYLIVILVASLTLYRRGAITASGLALATYALVVFSQSAPISIASWAAFSGLFLIVGVVGGYLSEELKRANENLSAKSQKIEKLIALHDSMIQSMPTGLLSVDNDMRIGFVNPAGEQILGRVSDELVGELLSKVEAGLVPFFESIEAQEVDDDSEESKAISVKGDASGHLVFAETKQKSGIARLQQTVRRRLGTREQMLRGDVATLDSEVAGVLGTNSSGGRILLFQDVTKLLHLEEKLKQHEKLAAVGQLAAGIAHEIRNPLASMSASIEMLRDSMPATGNPENRKLMEIAVREIDRLNRLITEFLDYVKPEKFRVESVDLKELLSEVVASARNLKEAREKIVFVENYGSAIAQGNVARLRQVIWNLVMNAVQSMDQMGKITVSCGPVSDKRVQLVVTDQGRGMSEEVLTHLYEPFFTTKDKGTGLGLATAYKIVEAHRGEIRVQSKLGSGTSFEVLLPAMPAKG